MAPHQPRPTDLHTTVNIDRMVRRARELNGRYASLQTESRAANRKLAEDLAMEAGRQLHRGLVRRPVSTGRLRKAIESPRNRHADLDLFSVGREDYLDRSNVRKYWRQIEGGESDAWMVLVRRKAFMVGYWRGPGGRKGFEPSEGRGGQQQAFVSTSPPQRGAMTRARKALGDNRSRARRNAGFTRDGQRVVGRVTRPIIAERFMQQAGDRFRHQRRAESYYEQLFAKAGLPIRFVQRG